jgi:hypothetical protein
MVFLEVDSAWLSLDGWVLGFCCVFCLVAMSGGVGCAVGAWAGVLFLGISVLGFVAWCLVVWGWLRFVW